MPDFTVLWSRTELNLSMNFQVARLLNIQNDSIIKEFKFLG